MTTYLATADLGTITGNYALAVDTIAHAGTDNATPDATVFITPIGEDLDEDAWTDLLAAAGFTPTGEWEDHDGYRTCDVEFTNQPPPNLPRAAAALVALNQLDPVHTAKRTPILGPAIADLLAARRDERIYEVSRGGWGSAAEALGLSEASVNRSVTRHRARIGATG